MLHKIRQRLNAYAQPPELNLKTNGTTHSLCSVSLHWLLLQVCQLNTAALKDHFDSWVPVVPCRCRSIYYFVKIQAPSPNPCTAVLRLWPNHWFVLSHSWQIFRATWQWIVPGLINRQKKSHTELSSFKYRTLSACCRICKARCPSSLWISALIFESYFNFQQLKFFRESADWSVPRKGWQSPEQKFGQEEKSFVLKVSRLDAPSGYWRQS